VGKDLQPEGQSYSAWLERDTLGNMHALDSSRAEEEQNEGQFDDYERLVHVSSCVVEKIVRKGLERVFLGRRVGGHGEWCNDGNDDDRDGVMGIGREDHGDGVVMVT
jgi:hypothetical protein